MLGLLIFLVLSGLVIGGLARLALPGPDPIGILGTIVLGLAGSFLGGLLGYVLIGRPFGFVLSVLVATGLLYAYRRLFQGRGLTGPRR
jgi:uncharacterized membrane protein YeaQ/YmgE (transglycosylase-associated protein family)